MTVEIAKRVPRFRPMPPKNLIAAVQKDCSLLVKVAFALGAVYCFAYYAPPMKAAVDGETSSLTRERIEAILKSSKENALRGPVYGEDVKRYLDSLDALARYDPGRTMKLVEEFRRAQPEREYDLWWIVMTAHGLVEFRDLCYDALSYRELFNQLPVEAQRYISTLGLLAVADEGLEQAFTTNIYDVEWNYALGCLEELGQKQYVGLLRKVEGLFGPNGPPKDYDARQKVIDSMTASNPQSGAEEQGFGALMLKIDKLYKEYAQSYEEATELEKTDTHYLLSLYAAKHAEILKKCVPLLKRHQKLLQGDN